MNDARPVDRRGRDRGAAPGPGRPPANRPPALPVVLLQVALALIARELSRPIRRPTWTDAAVWVAAVIVCAAFLLLIAPANFLLALIIGVALIVLAWRAWH